MKVLFAVSNSENNNEDIVDIICNEYQKQYKKIISYNRVFSYDAIVNEIKQFIDNQYDRIIISEDFEKNINEDIEEGEDATKYGEFITSYFAWVPMSKQKENVEKLENITKKKEK